MNHRSQLPDEAPPARAEDSVKRASVAGSYALCAGLLALLGCVLLPPMFLPTHRWDPALLFRVFLLCGGLLGLPSLLLGVGALRRARSVGARSTAAIAGLSLSGLALAFSLVMPVVQYPTYVYWRAVNRRLTCMMNAKQVALGLRMYIYDYDERLPPADAWSDAVAPCVKSRDIFVCPEARDLRSGYAFNKALGGKRVTDVRDEAQTVLIYESDLGWNGAGGPQTLRRPTRHRRGDVVAFVDGSVKLVSARDLKHLRWQP